MAVTLLAGREPLLEQPLVLAPLGAAKYYSERKPLDWMSFLMSPYGMMIGESCGQGLGWRVAVRGDGVKGWATGWE